MDADHFGLMYHNKQDGGKYERLHVLMAISEQVGGRGPSVAGTSMVVEVVMVVVSRYHVY